MITLKNLLLYRKRISFTKAEIVLKSRPDEIKYLITLRSESNHDLAKALLESFKQSECLFFVDDQLGMTSNCDFYLNYLKVKIPFKMSEFIKFINNPSLMAIHALQKVEQTFKPKSLVLLSFYDREEVLQCIFDHSISFFKGSASCQHGVMVGVSGYYPFNSDIFFAFSEKDRSFAKNLARLDRIKISGNLYLNKKIARETIKGRLTEGLNKRKQGVLMATSSYLADNIRMMRLAYRAPRHFSFYFKPHPNDKRKPLYYFMIWAMRTFLNVKIYREQKCDFSKYGMIATRFSSLVIEALESGVFPLIIPSNAIDAPHLMGPNDFFHLRNMKDLNWEDILSFYTERIDHVVEYFMSFNAPELKPSKFIYEELEARYFSERSQ